MRKLKLLKSRTTSVAMLLTCDNTSVCLFRRNSSEMGRTTYFQGYRIENKKNSCELFFLLYVVVVVQVGPCAPVMRINLIKYLTIKFEIFGWRARFQGK